MIDLIIQCAAVGALTAISFHFIVNKIAEWDAETERSILFERD